MGSRIRLYIVLVLFVALAAEAFRARLRQEMQDDDFHMTHDRDPATMKLLRELATRP